jgi:hypothetical protein
VCRSAGIKYKAKDSRAGLAKTLLAAGVPPPHASQDDLQAAQQQYQQELEGSSQQQQQQQHQQSAAASRPAAAFAAAARGGKRRQHAGTTTDGASGSSHVAGSDSSSSSGDDTEEPSGADDRLISGPEQVVQPPSTAAAAAAVEGAVSSIPRSKVRPRIVPLTGALALYAGYSNGALEDVGCPHPTRHRTTCRQRSSSTSKSWKGARSSNISKSPVQHGSSSSDGSNQQLHHALQQQLRLPLVMAVMGRISSVLGPPMAAPVAADV